MMDRKKVQAFYDEFANLTDEQMATLRDDFYEYRDDRGYIVLWSSKRSKNIMMSLSKGGLKNAETRHTKKA